MPATSSSSSANNHMFTASNAIDLQRELRWWSFGLSGLLLTFGTLFPPLGLAITATMFFYVLYAQMKVGRFLAQAMEVRAFKYVVIVIAQCQALLDYPLSEKLWVMVTLCCWFYACVLFDTLGDAETSDNAYWVVIFYGIAASIAVLHKSSNFKQKIDFLLFRSDSKRRTIR